MYRFDKIGIIILLVTFLISCKDETFPKSKSYLSLKYPAASYSEINTDCPFKFEFSDYAKVNFKNNCWANIEYPFLKATIHLTYREVSNNLDEILKEVEKLTFEHTIKADAISNRPFDDYDKKVFGKLYNVEGNVATNIQFRATDSLNHVISGALYFYSKPNYDSIVPALKYIEKDIMHLVETLEWK